MGIGTAVRKGAYFDSVFLMRVADRIGSQAGVRQVAAVMATAANKELLAEAGLSSAEASSAGANDLVVVVKAERDEVVTDMLARLDTWLADTGTAQERARSIDEAVRLLPDANLAVISVPGEHAAAEARRAIERGLHVFLFSDNVALDDEVALKRTAAERGLVVMGPDCGTAIIGGIGVGFANAVRRGPIGVVGASGTGIQELTTLIHRAGSGISHAVGTGSRDPSEEVGGITTLDAIAALDADRDTAAIVIISKPPAASTLERIRERVATATKPVVACFLGASVDPRGAVWDVVRTLDDAAVCALRDVGADGAIAAGDGATLGRANGRLVRGLFAGGSFCYQAQDIFRAAGITVSSNAPLPGMRQLEDPRRSVGHTLVDLGADEFTRGRPHPMIDSRLRRERLIAETHEEDVGVILLDVILGYGCAPDPAGDLASAIREARARRGSDLAVVASVTGTDWDPQSFDRQVTTLRNAGAVVARSSTEAARLAVTAVAA